MKLSLQHIVLSVAFLFLAVFTPAISYGQEYESAASDSVTIRNPEVMIYSAEDERSFDRTSVPAKDSSSFRPSHHQKTKPGTENQRQIEKNKEDKDDSIMSFNFLYYIIKKFKLSDIVDDE